MTKVDIVIVNSRRTTGVTEAQIELLRRALPQADLGSVIVVGASYDLASAISIDTAYLTPAQALAEAKRHAVSEQVIFLNSLVDFQTSPLSLVIAEAMQRPGLSFSSFKDFGANFSLPTLEADSLVRAIATCQVWPIPLINIRWSRIETNRIVSTGSITEALVVSMLNAMAEGDDVHCLDAQLVAMDHTFALMEFRLGFDQLGRVLQAVIELFNIEELFPNHSWVRHQRESAAASYHALAALFIRFGDFASAHRCLTLSEELEESPRALALKGLIAMLQGETLGAVANMVSSLQRYETRKKADGAHYLSFQPGDLQSINTKLQHGLEALNRRENELALQQFAAAVFNFDAFYSEYGVDRLAQRLQ